MSHTALACGPELGFVDVLESGYYRAEHIDIDDPCSAAGIADDGYASRYAEPVPIRSEGARVDVPEIAAVGRSPEPHTVVLDIAAWKMLPLAREGSIFASQITLHDDDRGCYRFAWSAVALDEQTLHVTREGTFCGEGAAPERACESTFEIEYALVQPCESPCTFVDDREKLVPDLDLGDDILLHANRCACP